MSSLKYHSLYIDVFLEGEFPGEFKKLQTETQQLLEEFKASDLRLSLLPLDKLPTELQAAIQNFQEKIININICVAVLTQI